MRRVRLAALVAGCLTLAVVAYGCSGSTPKAGPSPQPSRQPTPTATTAPPPPPAPAAGSCHRLSLERATSPTDSRRAVPCRSPHTTVTLRVGHFDPVRDGHLLGVDSRTVQDQISGRCSSRLLRVLGGSRDDRRLSRFTVVWFSPTVAQAQAGATWFRCDAVALAGNDRLAQLPSRVQDLLGRAHALDRFGTCGTAAPDSAHFQRVICSHRHRWRAVSVVGLPAGAHFHARSAAASANARCKQVAANASGGALKYTWAFEWPTQDQWRSGQRYGFCWLPTR